MDSSGVAPGDPVQDRDLDGDRGGPWWPVPVAPDPQCLHADAEVWRDSADRLPSRSIFESLSVMGSATGTLTYPGTERRGRTPLLLAATQNETPIASPPTEVLSVVTAQRSPTCWSGAARIGRGAPANRRRTASE